MKKPSTASLRYFALLLGTVGLLWSVSVSVADPRQWGPPGQPIRQGHHIEWQRAAYVDANGYTLMVWSDTRTGDRDVFAQLIEPDGDFAPGWPVHVVNFPYRQEDPEPIVATDGFIITWIDFRYDSTGDVFAQKLNYAGTKLWAPEGVVVDTHNTSMVNETTLRGASDGAGGAIIAFEDTRRGDAGDIFAQRILSNGTRGWANVLAVTDQPGPQNGITADTDGQGGLIVGWNDSRNDGNIYAAKITNTGTLPWGGVGGRVVCDFDGQQTSIKLCPDLTTGGAYFAWADKRDTVQAAFDIYGQRFNAAGNPQWAANGVAIAVDTLEQSGVRITPSISGGVQEGVVLCWQDTRVNGSVGEVYAQKMNAAGVAQWAANGIKIVGDAGPNGTGACRDNSRLTSDLSGGALYVWDDTRHDPCNILQYNTYMQHANAAGTLLCADGGFAVNTNVNQQQEAVLRTNGTNTYCIYSDFYRGSRTLRIAKIDVPGCSVIPNGDQEVLFGLDGDATSPTNIHMYWGNVAFVWEDNRGVNFGKQIYYQVLDTTYAKTYPFIPDNGTPIAPVSTSGTRFEQSKPFVCTDAQDGFYCAFENLNDGVVQVRLQRVGSGGHILCDEAGAIVHATGIDQKEAQVVSDGMGGCYVLWSGFDPSFQLDVYAMRMDGNCQPMWAEPTLLSNDASNDDHLQSAVADGNGCVVAVWETGEFGSYDILGAKVCVDGSIAWQRTVSAAPREQSEADAAADGQGGVYVAWSDTRDETSLKDIYAQRFNSAGEPQWTNNGRLIVTFANDQKIPRLAVDSQGQAYVAWQDFRNTDDLDIYGQKLALDGSRIWPETTTRQTKHCNPPHRLNGL